MMLGTIPPDIQEPMIRPMIQAIRIACIALVMESMMPFSISFHGFLSTSADISPDITEAIISGIWISTSYFISARSSRMNTEKIGTSEMRRPGSLGAAGAGCLFLLMVFASSLEKVFLTAEKDGLPRQEVLLIEIE